MDAAGSPARITVGSIIDDRYEVVSQLGSGGFATVYRARQRHIDRQVAIKVLSVALQLRDDATFERRFMREAQVVAQINHPNVVTVYDFGFTGALRQPYIAMELLEGHDLDAELAREGRLPARRALPLLIGALDALAVGHAAGIVHKDLKPANLHLSRSPDGREVLKVLDYGIARNAESEEATRFTATGQFMGTPQYAAPEYLERQEVSPALDVYQMGLILVEALTGRRVVDADSPIACMMAHSAGRLAVPNALLDTPLGPVVQTALAHDPQHRYKDAAGMRNALAMIDATLVDASLANADLGLVSAPYDAITGNAPTLAPDTGAFEGPRSIAAAGTLPQAIETPRSPLVPVLFAVGGLAVVAIAVMIVLLVTGGDDDATPAAEAEPAATETTTMAERTPDALESAPLDGAPVDDELAAPTPDAAATAPTDSTADDATEPAAPVETPPVVETVELRLDSDPSGASVEIDGESLGETPLTVSLEPEDEREVVLVLDGYRRDRFALTASMADGDGVVSRKLRKKRRRSRDRDDTDERDDTETGGGSSGMTMLP